MEAAALEAYRSLERALTLRDTAGSPPGVARQRVRDFFRQADCEPPTEQSQPSPTGGRFRCKLCIDGHLTFQNPDGVSKKQQAEQGAAKEALLRLAGVLGWDLGTTSVNENYKGRLQETLAKQGQMLPSYQSLSGPRDTEPSSTGAASEVSGAGGPAPQATGPVSKAETMATPPVDSVQLPPHRKEPKMESPELERMLRMFGLQPPSVKHEYHVEVELRYRMEIQLTNYTFQNQQGYSNTKDATRKTYLIFGQALGICKPSTEDNLSAAAVNQYFSQRSFSLPTKEVVEKGEKTFHCSLKVASCSFSYEGQGGSEESVKLDLCRQALSQLGPLFHYELAPRTGNTAEEAVQRLILMLEEGGQGPPAFRQTGASHRATVRLLFDAFTLESKAHSSSGKKLAQSQLSGRILGLLGEEDTDSSSTLNARNRVDEWFKQRRIPQPVFQDTKEAFGVMATFSGSVDCSHPDWQTDEGSALKRLKEELKSRFRHLTDGNADQGLSG
ncbi:hypothetical protein AAFF_G00365140 [Aldrovandia affinis]|uniref:Uncharacterized protein n=1 Tax=Aldrovandia affinis TaxID=143900 RepID=A0AAD7R562_9TELE|nr:hypothetical protein AAFF_G00365140 [Aldrovandia affinis]